MPPVPKPPELRQRRNTKSTTAKLTAPRSRAKTKLPALPDRDQPWHPNTKAWWADVWASPMAAQFLDADRHSLYLLAELVDRFWHEPTTTLASEIRLQRQAFGLTPIDRRRLDWKIDAGDQPERRTPPRKAPAKAAGKRAAKAAAVDPRAVLGS